MKRAPWGYVPLELFLRRFGLDPVMIEPVLAVGGLSTVTIDGDLWVHERGGEAWLASEPFNPLAFAEFGATIGGKPLVEIDAEVDGGDAS